MENGILFSERQSFKQWWIWIILLAIDGLFLYGSYKQLFLEEPFGNKPMNDTGLILMTSLAIILTLLFIFLRLDTKIKKDGIYVRFFPFHLSYKHYPWDSLRECYIRKYSPITEYGGWGVRLGLFGKGKAFNVSGGKGLQLEFTNQKKILIGTGKSDEMAKVLKEIGQLKRQQKS
ncbi:DUF6141 family protein [Parabacteroides sp. Marseille-P3160]|uniref:DUF6141 family protein n=1 Tax=Parabacteroides sp. Marseille-P3160 TaxID=1917887 RepID=UPI0009BA4383|nr:DUF6141 family protein [Parabacteroides sp. Marseille-P3160]